MCMKHVTLTEICLTRSQKGKTIKAYSTQKIIRSAVFTTLVIYINIIYIYLHIYIHYLFEKQKQTAKKTCVKSGISKTAFIYSIIHN